jgi:WD40 repeat protein
MRCPFCHASNSRSVRACHVCGGPLAGIKRLTSFQKRDAPGLTSSLLFPNLIPPVSLNKEIEREEPVLIARNSREKDAPRIVAALFCEGTNGSCPLFVLENGGLQVWDVQRNELHPISSRRTLQKPSLTVAAAFSSHCEIVATGLESGQVRLQRLELNSAPAGWKCNGLRVIDAHMGFVLSLATTKTRLYSAGSDGTVVMTNLPDASHAMESKETTVVLEGLSSLSCLALSPDGHFLALGTDDGQVQMWHLGEDGLKARLDWTSRKDLSKVKSLTFTPNGNMLLSCNAQGQLCLWAAQTGHRLQWLARPNALNAPTFAPDSRLLAHTNTSEGILLCDAWTGELRRMLPPIPGGVQALGFSFSPEKDTRETLLIVGGLQQIVAWKVVF